MNHSVAAVLAVESLATAGHRRRCAALTRVPQLAVVPLALAGVRCVALSAGGWGAAPPGPSSAEQPFDPLTSS